MDSFTQYASTKKFIVNLGLERVSALLEHLGNPQEKTKIIHVAGTNGKGSVCAFLSSILTDAGFKTGLFSSPELVDIHERISVNKTKISPDDLNRLFDKIQIAAKFVEDVLGEMPSPFEIWTACAYLYFYETNCDYAIVEVGMGGLTDATNVITQPVLSVITSISLDHTDFLGTSLSSIARHKAGIIKPGCRVVTTRQHDDVMNIILSACTHSNSPCTVATPSPLHFDGIYEVINYSCHTVRLGIGGINQTENAAIAIECARILNIDDSHIIRGLARAEHKARFELLSTDPTIIFDGAHNPDGAVSLSRNLTRYFGNKKFVFIYAAMADKDISSILSALSPHASEFVFTTVSGNTRSATREYFDSLNIPGTYFENLSDALSYAKTKSRDIIITGSLYLYKDLFS